MHGLDGAGSRSYRERAMDGDERSSRQTPEPESEPRSKTLRVIDGDAARITARERDALLDRIDAEVAEIDGRNTT
jgi:hypothetical protein